MQTIYLKKLYQCDRVLTYAGCVCIIYHQKLYRVIGEGVLRVMTASIVAKQHSSCGCLKMVIRKISQFQSDNCDIREVLKSIIERDVNP